jgi:transcriptional regulator with XRE-family HTH domain
MLTADNLETIRKFYRLHQSDIASLLGVTQSYIAHIENGYRPLTPNMRSRLAFNLDLTPEKLTSILQADAEYKRRQAELGAGDHY